MGVLWVCVYMYFPACVCVFPPAWVWCVGWEDGVGGGGWGIGDLVHLEEEDLNSHFMLVLPEFGPSTEA